MRKDNHACNRYEVYLSFRELLLQIQLRAIRVFGMRFKIYVVVRLVFYDSCQPQVCHGKRRNLPLDGSTTLFEGKDFASSLSDLTSSSSRSTASRDQQGFAEIGNIKLTSDIGSNLILEDTLGQRLDPSLQ
jgi:hypothetical protein